MIKKEIIQKLEQFGFEPRKMSQDDIEEAVDMIKALGGFEKAEEAAREWL